MMNKISASLLLAIFSLNSVWAGLPPPSVQGQSDASPQTKFNVQVPYNQKTDLGGIKALLETGNSNLLANGSFEAATVMSGWGILNGSGVADTTNVVDGKSGLKITTASQQFYLSNDVTPTVQLAGITLEASCWVKTSVTTLQVCGRTAGAQTGTCTPVPATGNWVYVPTTFLAANGASVGVQLNDTVSETIASGTTADLCYVGISRRVGIVSNVSNWQTYPMVITSSSGTNPTKATSPTVDIARYRQIGGSYELSYDYQAPNNTGAVNGTSTYLFSLPAGAVIDATQVTIPASPTNYPVLGSGNTSNIAGFGVTQSLALPAPYDTTHLYLMGQQNGTDGGDRCTVGGASAIGGECPGSMSSASFTVAFRATVPIVGLAASSIAYTPSTNQATWSGALNATTATNTAGTASEFTTSGGSLTLNPNTSLNFGTPTFRSSGYGLTFTPPRTGTLHVCMCGTMTNTATGFSTIYMTDGTNTIINGQSGTTPSANALTPFSGCGLYAATATSTSFHILGATSTGTQSIGSTNVQVTMYYVDQNVNAAVLAGNVMSSSLGSQHIENAFFAGDATPSTDCTSSPCTMVTHTPAVTSVTRSSTGVYVIHFAAGTFPATPNCTANSDPFANNGIEQLNYSSSSATAFQLTNVNGSFAATDGAVHVMCISPN